MSKYARLAASLLVPVLCLLYAMAGAVGTASAHPAAQASDPVATVMALATAYNSADEAQMRALLDPSFRDVVSNPPPGLPAELAIANLDGFIALSKAGLRVQLSNCRASAPDTVTCDAVLSGPPLPPLPHPFTEKETFTFSGGKITLLTEIYSDQTYNDLAVFSSANPPGMPTTGVGSPSAWPIMLALVALTLMGAGVRIRLRALSSAKPHK